MKIGVVKIPGLSAGRVSVKDARVDTLQKMFNSPKKVYVQVDVVTESEKLFEADGILCLESAKLDLVVSDMEFVETRLARSTDEIEKKLMVRFKDFLDSEKFLSEASLDEAEKKLIEGYSLLTIKPVYCAPAGELDDADKLLLAAYAGFGYISFFTAGEKDAHAWSIKKGSNAWEASGCIHSDIQKGFIRAEVVGFQDLVSDGSLNQARNNNHVRLENKEYIVADGDYLVFRFSK
jgi:ribosome-binding ATPase YchF (GTP1/OBG family)